MTPVVGENSMNLTALNENLNFVNPIRFPFDFTWPVSTHLYIYFILLSLSFGVDKFRQISTQTPL